MAVLAYQFPDGDIKKMSGRWVKSSIEDLPLDHFFISNFTKSEVFYFVAEQVIEKIVNQSLYFNSSDSIFVVHPKAYLNGLQYFIDGFEHEGIQKAIFSRIKLVEKHKEDNIDGIFHSLTDRYKHEALVYLVSDEKFGTWMGATPEILLSGNQELMKSVALAGTKREKEDEWTKKEEEEHQYVVDFVKTKIASQAPLRLQVLPTETVKKGAVYHLETRFEFSIAPIKWNTLMRSLHPTPAVCGTPQEAAQKYILENEPHDRMFYTGLIGWRGKESLSVYVNLRCMQVVSDAFALYLGGGITQSSDIVSELQETEDKSETLLKAIVN
ncbi:hypothetical protein CW751_05760 [Brumimicrobium salinarum]|uniref:Chorismate-utilising enzyme C-terminal domain-containing protein n=1 Tax=Brumimicrobium salinarum TaxID=2058658 RepID=A0A2I0R3C9_9FLAO|nr:chorismate-binding protein [Brumimicrobium salinarum]PKR81088.1 hypothetical protein CW751_05760 [Brumimicrobium salinarum]